MLRPLLFSPAAVWLARALQETGVERFLLLTEPDFAAAVQAAADCLPGVSAAAQVCAGDAAQRSQAVRDFAAQAEPAEEVLAVCAPVWLSFSAAAALAAGADVPCPAGVFRLSARELARTGELPGAGAEAGVKAEADGTAAPLTAGPEAIFRVQELARMDFNRFLMARGVRMLSPATAYIDPTVTVAPGATLLPNVILRGDTRIGANCEIGPDTMIRDCTLGEGCVANASQLNEAVFGRDVNIGPFAYVRPGTRVADGCKVGDFVEVKNAVIGQGTKLPHLIYVGDSDVGAHCNFGCGSITCNYDGKHKYRTTVGDNVFIGCNTNLVAPVTVEDGAFTAAGSTITDTVPADALAVARARQVHKPGWARRHREQS